MAKIEDSLSKICVSCGMCCDGTLYNKAILKDNNDETLAQSLGLETFKSENE